MITILLVSNNAHKVAEFDAMLGGRAEVMPLSSLKGAPEPVENGDTFAANAAIKLETIRSWIGDEPSRSELAGRKDVFLLADDSGLEVDALGGAPGVRSARFAADETGDSGNSPDAANNAKLLRLLNGIPTDERTARFRCVLAFAPLSGGEPLFFDGAVEGEIAVRPSGKGGFGYDPLFVPRGHSRSFADLGEDLKNELSHRANALADLKAHLDKHVA